MDPNISDLLKRKSCNSNLFFVAPVSIQLKDVQESWFGCMIQFSPFPLWMPALGESLELELQYELVWLLSRVGCLSLTSFLCFNKMMQFNHFSFRIDNGYSFSWCGFYQFFFFYLWTKDCLHSCTESLPTHQVNSKKGNSISSDHSVRWVLWAGGITQTLH